MTRGAVGRMAKMSKSSEGEGSSPIYLQLVTPSGPALSHHAGGMLGDTLYIHGGINTYMSKEPLSGFYTLNLAAESPIWTEIRDEGSPKLSHHACVVLDQRYLFFFGGWNGKVRTTDAFAYDTQEQKWLTIAVSGFPEGAGLSSHTAALLEDESILIIGREGSARLQRRYGNAWYLRGSIKSKLFTYTEHQIHLASRSGHTMHIMGRNCVILGGRSDRHVEIHSGYRTHLNSQTSKIFKNLTDFTKKFQPMVKHPCGRKHHVSAAGSGLILVHGGETFDGKSREPVSDFYLVSLKPEVQWYHLGASGVGRAGHLCVASAERVILHGGLGARKTVYGDTYEVKLS